MFISEALHEALVRCREKKWYLIKSQEPEAHDPSWSSSESS